jgi:hypothetical protein
MFNLKIKYSKKKKKQFVFYTIRIPPNINTLQLQLCTMLTEPQVHLLISMSSRSIGMIHIPLVSAHNDPSGEGKNIITL